MGREGTWLKQGADQPVDVTSWHADEQFGIYPERARDKTLLHAPKVPPYDFLTRSHTERL